MANFCWVLTISTMLVLVFPAEAHYRFLSQAEVDVTDEVAFHDETLCASNQSLVILVKSRNKNFALRRAIRETWGRSAYFKYHIPLAFVLGSTNDESLNKRIDIEGILNGDIIRGKFIDHYYNLTLKTMFTLNWAATYCQDTSWILYVDDDSVVSLSNVVTFVNDLEKKGSETRKFLHCRTNVNATVNRDKTSKWYLPQSAFNKTVYPPYCTGLGYFISPQTAAKLYTAAKDPETRPKLWIDDIYVTGISTQAGNISLQHTKHIYPYLYESYIGREEYYLESNMVVGELKPAQRLLDFWSNATNHAPLQIKMTIEKFCGFPICWSSFLTITFLFVLSKVVSCISKPIYKFLASRIVRSDCSSLPIKNPIIQS